MFLIIFCFLFFSLGIYAQQIPEIKIDPSICVTGDLKLSDLVESIEYIPLETTDKCLVGVAPRTFDISENYIVLHCWKTKQVYLFKRDGSFVSLIGREGSGPGEYLAFSVSGVFIDEQKKLVYVGTSSPNQLSAYNLTGNFLTKYPVNKQDETATFICRINNEFLLNYANSGTVSHLYELRTSIMNLKTKAVNNIPYSIKNTFVGYQPSFDYMYENKLHIAQPSMNDTVYMIDKERKFTPKYRISLGKYEVNPELRSDGDELWKKMPELANRVSTFETKNHLFISNLFKTKEESKRKEHFSYYQKKEMRLYYFDSEKGIPNDYDGGIAFWPTTQDETTWYAFYEADQVCGERSEEQTLKPKGSPKAIQVFKQTCKKMQPDDNPVLMIVKLKK